MEIENIPRYLLEISLPLALALTLHFPHLSEPKFCIDVLKLETQCAVWK